MSKIKKEILKTFPFVTKFTRLWKDGSVTLIRSGHAKDLYWCRRKTQVNGYWKGTYEMPVQNALRRLIKKGDVVYDIGANSGFHTLLSAKLVGSEGVVYAAEPFPQFIEELETNIKINNLSNVVVVNVAVSD